MKANVKNPVYVGFWARFSAFFIDSLIVSIMLLPLTNTANLDIAILSDPVKSEAYLESLMLQMGMELLFFGVLFILFWKIFAATPGKLLFKSYIVNADDFKPATSSQLIIRYFAYFLSLLPLGLGFLWIALDKKKQAWHDKIAKTVVIREKPEA
ncbi:MAG: putative RDD family membrane protein YckC [Candidatus Azotimanducaceae bacterium]